MVFEVVIMVFEGYDRKSVLIYLYVSFLHKVIQCSNRNSWVLLVSITDCQTSPDVEALLEEEKEFFWTSFLLLCPHY